VPEETQSLHLLDKAQVALTVRDMLIILVSIVSTAVSATVAWVNLSNTDNLMRLQLSVLEKQIDELRNEARRLNEQGIVDKIAIEKLKAERMQKLEELETPSARRLLTWVFALQVVGYFITIPSLVLLGIMWIKG